MKKVLIITAIILVILISISLLSVFTSKEDDGWKDYYGNDEIYDINLTREIRDFPGTEFVWTALSFGTKLPNGVDTFIYGFPIWNVFFHDITGDGLDDICVTVSVEEDTVSDRIVIHDYQNNVSYEVSDPGNYNFRLKEENGELVALKDSVTDKNDSTRGRIVFNDVYMVFEEIK